MSAVSPVLSGDIVMLYGQDGTGTSPPSAKGSPAAQTLAETLSVSATANARKFRGSKKTGHFSIHFFNATASGATSTATVWYSDLPNPDPTNDAHWVQDASITAIDMTTTGVGTFVNVGNVYAEWVRVKPSTVTTAGTVWCWVRVEGTTVN